MISVIIPIYNTASKGLEHCLEAVANQSFQDLQVVLVDDGSTDGSGEICQKWVARDPRFELIRQDNLGPAMARNAGLMRASGQEIAFVDSDDLPDVQMLEWLHSALVAEMADMSMARYESTVEARFPLYAGSRLPGKEMLKGIFDYQTPVFKALYAKLFRREVLCGLSFEDLRTGEDIDFLSKVYVRVRLCACIDQIVYRYNDWDDSIMHTQQASDYLDILSCYENMVKRLADVDEVIYGRALDALMRKIVSSRYRNRLLKSRDLSARLVKLTSDYLPAYKACENGNIWVKRAIISSIKMPWLHALIMNIRER